MNQENTNNNDLPNEETTNNPVSPEASSHHQEEHVNNTPPKENNDTGHSGLGVALLDGETVVKEVSKHPIGALISTLTGFGVSIAILTITVVASLYLNSDDSLGGTYSGLILVLGVILSIVVLIATFIYVYLYRQNRLIVTTEKVALIRYHSIFSRKVTQLSIERVQDVTVYQVGILPRLYKYGTINIETAGETEDCIFSFSPMPYELSKTIMDVHEKAVINTRHVV